MEFLSAFSLDSHLFSWVILPLLIFLARICDQTIGTLRLIFVSKGFKHIVPFLAFFESMIWLIAISQILGHLENAVTFLAYGLGYATGNYVGMRVEERLSIGSVIIRIFSKEHIPEFIKVLQTHNYGYTIINAEGSTGELKIIFSIINRKYLSHLIKQINAIDSNTFYTVEEVKSVKKGIFKASEQKSFIPSFRRKGDLS
ncbi:MAG: DUF2179 domain-containing protein [Lentimicrobiaceae bacterium]|nr:DUF2179 domain-containing protein [Lentimicrobiaceae bacterium]